MKKLFLALAFVLVFPALVLAQLLQSASVTLDDAQIKALPTTGVEIVAAPGANKLLVPVRAVLYFSSTTNYGNIAGSAALGVLHNNGYGLLTSLFESPSSQITNLLANDDDGLAVLAPLINLDTATPKPYATDFWPPGLINQNITIRGYNGFNGNFTGGDPANTLKVVVYYYTVDL